MKLVTINISSFKIHHLEPLRTATYGDGGYRADADTTNTTGETNITDPVSIRVFEAPAPDPLNDEAFGVVFLQPMSERTVLVLSPLT